MASGFLCAWPDAKRFAASGRPSWCSSRPSHGRLWKAKVIARDTRDNAFPLNAIVSLTFKQHDSLGLLVPATMHEEFFAGVGRRAWGDATYTNYRRFQTSARIVPQ